MDKFRLSDIKDDEEVLECVNSVLTFFTNMTHYVPDSKSTILAGDCVKTCMKYVESNSNKHYDVTVKILGILINLSENNSFFMYENDLVVWLAELFKKGQGKDVKTEDKVLSSYSVILFGCMINKENKTIFLEACGIKDFSEFVVLLQEFLMFKKNSGLLSGNEETSLINMISTFGKI